MIQIECEIEKETLKLKIEITKQLVLFFEKCKTEDKNFLFPYREKIAVNALNETLSDFQYQINGIPSFTSKQIDHICYQIGEWYLKMKPLLEGQHNLGYMKEVLKTMICGDK